MSKLFNAQNLSQRKTRFSTVWLNIKNFSCSSWEFIGVTAGGEALPATPRDFLLTQTRKINYAYAGGINECDYVESTTTDRNNNTTFRYELRKVSIPYLNGYVYQLYNLPKAAFMNGSPVMNISVRIAPGKVEIYFSPLTNQYQQFIRAISELHASSQEVNPGYYPEDMGDGTTIWWKYPELCQDDLNVRDLTQADLYNIGQASGPAYFKRVDIEALTQTRYETEYPVLSWFPRFNMSGSTPIWSICAFLNTPDYVNPNAFVFDLENPEPSGGMLYQASKSLGMVFTPSQGEWHGSAYLEMI